MSRTNRDQRNRNHKRAATYRLTQAIERQLRSLTDEDVFSLTFSGDRHTREVANREAHKRAEQYALTH